MRMKDLTIDDILTIQRDRPELLDEIDWDAPVKSDIQRLLNIEEDK